MSESCKILQSGAIFADVSEGFCFIFFRSSLLMFWKSTPQFLFIYASFLILPQNLMSPSIVLLSQSCCPLLLAEKTVKLHVSGEDGGLKSEAAFLTIQTRDRDDKELDCGFFFAPLDVSAGLPVLHGAVYHTSVGWSNLLMQVLADSSLKLNVVRSLFKPQIKEGRRLLCVIYIYFFLWIQCYFTIMQLILHSFSVQFHMLIFIIIYFTAHYSASSLAVDHVSKSMPADRRVIISSPQDHFILLV